MTAHVEVRLEVDAGVLSSCDKDLVARLAEAELAALLAELDVDVQVSVTVAAGSNSDAVAVLFREGEVIADFPVADLTTLSVLGVPPDLAATPPDQVVGLLGALIRQLAAHDVPRLLGEDAMRQMAAPVEIVRHLLDLWIRVPDAATMAGFADEFGEDALAEAIVAARRPVEARLRVAPDYLRALTGLPHEDAFTSVRARLGRRLGSGPPALHFEAAPEVGEHLIQPVVNDVRTIPVRGLAPDLIVVAERADRLREAGFAAEPMQQNDPDQKFAFVPARDRERLAEAYTCWNAVEVIAYWWESFAPIVAWRTFDARDVERLLERLRPTLPVLARVADSVPARLLAGRLRSLYRSNSSLQPLPLVLERQLEDLLLGRSPRAPWSLEL